MRNYREKQVEAVMSMTIDQLELPAVTMTNLIKRLHPECLFADEARPFFTKVTVRDVIGTYKSYLSGMEALNGSDRRFIKKLVELGLNRLDWAHLPQSTVNLETLRKYRDLDMLLQAPAIALGATSRYFLLHLFVFRSEPENIHHNDEPDPTLEELLQFRVKGIYREGLRREFRQNWKGSVVKVRKLLKKLDLWVLAKGDIGWLETRREFEKRLRMSVPACGDVDGVINFLQKEKLTPKFLE